MKSILTIFLLLASLVVPVTAAEEEEEGVDKTAIVFIANYDKRGNFSGWGSGFYIDEGIVVTNKHVIETGKYFIFYATGSDEKINFLCRKEIEKSDMKVNLDDDVAYVRVYLQCPHGVLRFAEKDPEIGDAIAVLGYPSEDTADETLEPTITRGTVTGYTFDNWLKTDAFMHKGNSGGPVLKDGEVVGVAVAKGVDSKGNFIAGYFVPNSVIIKGLLYANNSTFGYTAQDLQKFVQNAEPASDPHAEKREANDPFDPVPTGDIASNLDCSKSLGEGGKATGYGGCECKPSYHPDEARTTCLPGAPGWEDPYERLGRAPKEELDEPASLTTLPTPVVTKEYTAKRPYDVPENVWYGEALDVLLAEETIDTEAPFRASDAAPRGEVVDAIVKSLIGEDEHWTRPSKAAFDDVPRTLLPYFEAAAGLGWVRGMGNCLGRHPCYANPQSSINRAEAATLIVRAYTLKKPEDAAAPTFSDLTPGAWYVEPITHASSRCILRGDQTGDTVRPSDTMNRAEMVTMIQRARKAQVYPACD